MSPGELLRERRRELGWSQAQLAAVAGTGQAVISRIESGRLNPTVELVARLAAAMNAELRLSLVAR